MESVRRLLPQLSSTLRKGSCGKVAVVGGSAEYTGAPFFAAISALRLGADLVHVMCSPDAAPVIKTYSPDIIVHPGLDPDSIVKKLERIDALVVGPGLGREPALLPLLHKLLHHVREHNIPFVMDGDALWFVSEKMSELCSLETTILTPNLVEFSRLCKTFLAKDNVLDIKDTYELQALAGQLSAKMETTIFMKHAFDYIVNPDRTAHVGEHAGCTRRCGGQGDVTAGTLAVFLLWASRRESTMGEAKLSAGAACSWLVRECGRRAQTRVGRGMITSDVVAELVSVLRDIDMSS